jgi:hypothetical protein
MPVRDCAVPAKKAKHYWYLLTTQPHLKPPTTSTVIYGKVLALKAQGAEHEGSEGYYHAPRPFAPSLFLLSPPL